MRGCTWSASAICGADDGANDSTSSACIVRADEERLGDGQDALRLSGVQSSAYSRR